MRQSRITVVLAVVLVLGIALPAMAFVPRAGNTVVVAESIDDDVYVAGGTVEVSGEIDGDVVAAGGTVTLSGPVTGGILSGAGTLSIGGTVGRSVRAAAGNLALRAEVGTDAVLAGGSVTLERSGSVGRDLVAAGAGVQLSGRVQRNAYLTGGTITIGGSVDGNVEAHADRVVLLPTAQIAGKLRYSADYPIEIPSGAQVTGDVTRVDRPSRSRTILDPATRFRIRFAGRILETLWLLALGLVLMAITPRGIHAVAERIRTQFGGTLLAGFVLLVIVPVAAVVLLFTVVGVPVALALLLLYVTTLYPGQVFVAAWLGEALTRQRGRGGSSPYLSLIVGVIVLIVLVSLPFVGWMFRLLAVCVGFGALWAAIWRTRRGQPVAA